MRLRYTGQLPVSFISLPYLGEVEPGEFEVRDSDAELLLQRADVEDPGAESAPDSEPPAASEAPAPAKPRKASLSKTSDAEPAPADTTPTTSA